MIYLVTNKSYFKSNDKYKIISVEESLDLLSKPELLQFDTETTGLDPHLCKLRMIQFGSDKFDFQIVVDVETISPYNYKEILESKILVGHNIKFDLKFLYSLGIIPREVYDTHIIEQLIYLGYDYTIFRTSLLDVAWRRLQVTLSKDVRKDITTRRMDEAMVFYAAKDVEYLEKILTDQKKDLIKKDLVRACKFECKVIPAIAYLEWCGIKLDPEKWKAKMVKDKQTLDEALKALNSFVESDPKYKSFTEIPKHGDLFEEVSYTPRCTINWDSPSEVVEFFKFLGFDTEVVDSKTKQLKDSVQAKIIAGQKGINDEFLHLYLAYKEAAKVVSSYGEVFINSINPKTGRLHTDYKQIGTISGRMSSGGGNNTELARFKLLSPSSCKNSNHQQLPSDHDTRSSFVAEKGNLFCSCDFSALESRLGAEIYNDQAMIKEYLEGSGDIHSLAAKACFPHELEGVEIKDIKKVRPDLRKKAKAPEFAVQFGGGAKSISESLSISKEEAQLIEDNFYKTFTGIKSFKEKGGKFVKENGYILICKATGHKMYWKHFEEWLEEEQSYRNDPTFWDTYRQIKQTNPNHSMILGVRTHMERGSKIERLALNAPTQGSGAIIIKEAAYRLFDWILKNNYFNRVKIVNITHDEINVEFPEELKDTFPEFLSKLMEESAANFYTVLPYPAEPAVGDHWIH